MTVQRYTVPHRSRLWLFGSLAAALLAATLAPFAFAGSGTLTIASVSGSSPGPYTITLTSSPASVTVGDDFGAKLSSGAGAIYEVTAVNAGALQITVADTRSYGEAAVYGPPAAGACWYATPTRSGAADDVRQPRPPHGAVGWDAPMRLGLALISSNVGIYYAAAPAAASTGTGSYNTVATAYTSEGYFDANGAMLRVTANLRQNGGSGVIGRLTVAGATTPDVTTAGEQRWMIVRESSTVLGVFNGSTRTAVTLTASQAVQITADLKGNGAAGSTLLDFIVIERLR